MDDSHLEFQRTIMIETRSTMKGKYKADQYYCPHGQAGWMELEEEMPEHLMVCKATPPSMWGWILSYLGPIGPNT